MHWIILLLVSLITIWIINKWITRRTRLPLPPGPSLLESFKIMVGFMFKEELPMVSAKLAQQYGEICNIRFLGQNMVFLNSSRLIRKLLVSPEYRDITNDRPPSYLRDYVFYHGSDIGFSDYNEKLIKRRKIVHKAANVYGENIQAFEDMVDAEIQYLEDRVMESIDDEKFDMDRALSISLMRIIHVFLINERLSDIQDANEVYSIIEDFSNCIKSASAFDTNLVLSMFPWLHHLPGPLGTLVKVMDQSGQRIIDYFLDPKRKEDIHGNDSLVGSLYAEMDKDPDLTMDEVKGIVRDIIAGGMFTTKGFLAGFFLLMMHYPEIQHKIQEELDGKLGTKRPSLHDRSVLHYTNAAILECFRYIRHIPHGLPHITNTDIEVDGYRIPANSTLLLNHWFCSREGSLWKQPNAFEPERYLDENDKLLPADHPIRKEFTPFGIGRRVCVGEAFAKSRIFMFVTTLLHKFEFQRGDNELELEDSSTWVYGVTLQPKTLFCKIVKRN